MNTIVKLRTRYSIQLELDKIERQRRFCIHTGIVCAIICLLALLFLSGCGTTSAPITKAALTSAVAIGEQFALEKHPEVTPYIKAAADVVCATANGTNASPDNIVKALNTAGITNAEARLIVNGSLAIYDVVYAAIGTNQSQVLDYAKALCNGMQQGLPRGLGSGRILLLHNLPPHLE